jgi:hypothetical protein
LEQCQLVSGKSANCNTVFDTFRFLERYIVCTHFQYNSLFFGNQFFIDTATFAEWSGNSLSEFCCPWHARGMHVYVTPNVSTGAIDFFFFPTRNPHWGSHRYFTLDGYVSKNKRTGRIAKKAEKSHAVSDTRSSVMKIAHKCSYICIGVHNQNHVSGTQIWLIRIKKRKEGETW